MQGFVAVIVHVDLLADASETELVGNHKGIHRVVLGKLRIGLLKILDLFGVEHMDFPVKPAQTAILPEGVYQIICPWYNICRTAGSSSASPCRAGRLLQKESVPLNQIEENKSVLWKEMEKLGSRKMSPEAAGRLAVYRDAYKALHMLCAATFFMLEIAASPSLFPSSRP